MEHRVIDEALAQEGGPSHLSCPACSAKVPEAIADHDRKIRITDIMETIGNLLEEP